MTNHDELCEKDGEKELQDADREGGWAEMAKCIEWRDKEIKELRTRLEEAKTSSVQAFLDNPNNPLIKELAQLRTRVAELTQLYDGMVQNHKNLVEVVKPIRKEREELRKRVAELERELVIARQTHFQREKSLEKRLQLMGEKVRELQYGKL